MVVLTAETCWALNEYWIYNKISGIKLVSLYSTKRKDSAPNDSKHSLTSNFYLFLCELKFDLLSHFPYRPVCPLLHFQRPYYRFFYFVCCLKLLIAFISGPIARVKEQNPIFLSNVFRSRNNNHQQNRDSDVPLSEEKHKNTRIHVLVEILEN